MFASACSGQPPALGGAEPWDDAARAVLDEAVAAWHLADRRDGAGADSAVEAVGDVELGVSLDAAARKASHARGGDGLAARLGGGYLSAGQGVSGELNLTGEAMTMLIRLRSPSGEWDKSLFSKHGGHDDLIYNLFTLDSGVNGPGMDLAFQLGLEDQPPVEVRVPFAHLGAKDQWLDVIVRYDGRYLDLFVDGVRVDRAAARGALRGRNNEPCVIGGESHDGEVIRPFAGLIDHAALWDEALSREQVVRLSGGREVVEREQAAYDERLAALATKQRRAKERKMRGFADDPYRPRYHFMPPVYWMNEPHGPSWFQGRWHLFYQHNPHGAFWGTIHWGHATSENLVRWQHQPIALAPEVGPDQEGVWSGDTIVHEGKLIAFYTGRWRGRQCINMATSTDGVHFTKHDGNPVIPHAPSQFETPHGFRDPDVWSQGEGEAKRWYMIVGSGTPDGATVFLYRSRNLTDWQYLGRLMQGDRPDEVPVWEMPQFWRLNDEKWMLIVNQWVAGRENPYWIGTWEDEAFEPERRGVLTLSEHFLSPTGGYGPDGRLTVFGIAAGPRRGGANLEAGWAHAAGLPRRVWWREDDKLGVKPVEALRQLRFNHRQRADVTIEPGSITRLADIEGDQLELIVELDPGDAEKAGVIVRRSPDGEEQTQIYYDAAAARLEIDRSRSSLNEMARRSSQRGSTELGVLGGHVEPGDDGHVRLHLFLDRGLIEGFVNRHRCFATWAYPERADSTGVALFAEGGAATAVSIDAWSMRSIEIGGAARAIP